MTETKAPIVALMYDFDKTLCPLDMQEYGLFDSLGTTPEAFYERADSLSDDRVMDMILASMYMMRTIAKEKKLPMTRDWLRSFGASIDFAPGIPDWFDRIDRYAEQRGLIAEHYIISSGLKELIEGSSIADRFKMIFASEYYYGEDGLARWPLNTVNYTGKTQYIFRINKGILDISDDHVMSAYIPDERRRVPFEHMIYIGDGLTDIPCMKLVKSKGGKSVAVYPPGGYERVDFLQRQHRVNFTAEADYRPDSLLSRLTEGMLDEIAARHTMQQFQITQTAENHARHASRGADSADTAHDRTHASGQ